jgi:Flp pilus assembly protein TadG
VTFTISWRLRPSFRRCTVEGGGVSTEFAIVAPIIILVATGIIDFGMLASELTALTATIRIGAGYARAYPMDAVGIQAAMQNAMQFTPALTFPASFPQSCECGDNTSISCSESCASVGRPGPNRMFMTVTASRTFVPLVPWPGVSNTLTATAQVRLQ